jgi:hypothetical protein
VQLTHTKVVVYPQFVGACRSLLGHSDCGLIIKSPCSMLRVKECAQDSGQVPRSAALSADFPEVRPQRWSLSRRARRPPQTSRSTKQAVKYEFIRRICAIWLSAPLHKWRAVRVPVIYRALTRTTRQEFMPARQKRDNFEKGKKEVRGTAISRL